MRSQVAAARDGARRAVYEPEALVAAIGAILAHHPQPPTAGDGRAHPPANASTHVARFLQC